MNEEAPPDAEDSTSRSAVEVTFVHNLVVIDKAALRAAVDALLGPPTDAGEEQMRDSPSHLVGLFLSAQPELPPIPGVFRTGGGFGVGPSR